MNRFRVGGIEIGEQVCFFVDQRFRNNGRVSLVARLYATNGVLVWNPIEKVRGDSRG